MPSPWNRPPARLFAAALALALAGTSHAVLTNETAVTTAPAVANWDSGWGASGVTGWDYVGSVGGASGVYLGNGWVLTAVHVGAGDFTLDGVTYGLVAGSPTAITNANGSAADLVLFQIAAPPNLPSLAISSAAPAKLSLNSAGDHVVLIGFGGGAKSWGRNMVTASDESISPQGSDTVTVDFGTKYGAVRFVDNQAKAVVGDSGGAGFIYDASTGTWKLAGMIQAVSQNGDTYLAQLNVYAAQIEAIRAATPVPEAHPLGLLILGAGAAVGGLAWRRRFVPKFRRLVPILVPRGKDSATLFPGS